MSNFINDTLQQQIERGEVFGGVASFVIQYQAQDSFLISTGAEQVSFRSQFNGPKDDVLAISIYEGVTTSADGSAAPLFNLNLNSANTINASVFTSPTISGVGTLLFAQSFYGNDQPDTGPLSRDIGMVLEPNTKYRVWIINSSTGDSGIDMSYFLRDVT